MKRLILAMAILFSTTGSASALAEEQAPLEKPAETIASDTEASTIVNPGTSKTMPGKGMMHGVGQHGKGQGGMMRGSGQWAVGSGQCGKGQGGMKHGGGQHGKKGHEKNRQVVQRLDMIEARMAKIEAMLEILMRR